MLTFVPVMKLADLPESRAVGVDAGARRVALVRIGTEVYAYSARCSHAGGRLDRSPAINHTVTCIMHGARFDVRTGQCVNSPYPPVRTYPVRIVGEDVEVGLEAGEEPDPPFFAG